MYLLIRNKNGLWQPCFLSDQEKMMKLYKEPSIEAPYQMLIHLAKLFQRKRYLMYQSIKKKESSMAAMFLV